MLHEYEKVTDGVFINTNEKDLASYKMARERAYREKAMGERIERLEQEIIQIKQLLQKHLG